MKTLKKVTLLMLVFCMSLFFGMAIMLNNNTTAKADNDLVIESFTMVDGASVRTQEPNGIRFTVEISSKEYSDIITKYGEANVEFGTRIGKGTIENLEALKTKGTEVKRTLWDSKYNPTNSSSNYRYNLAIEGFADSNLNKNYIAIGYIKANGNVIKWTDDVVVRTPIQVATAHINTLKQIDNTDPEQEFVLKCVDTVMSAKETFDFQDENVEIKCSEQLKPVVLIDGVEVTAEYSVANSEIAVVENGYIKGIKMGDTTITATIHGYTGDYTCQSNLSVTKNEITPMVKADGTLKFDIDDEVVVKVNDESIGSYKNGALNIVDYILTTKTINQTETFTISIDSDSCSGEVAHTLSPINNANFKTTLANVTAANRDSTHYFLTEDIFINPWVSDSNKGDFTTQQGAAYSVFWNMYANLDGRGYKISYSVNSESAQFGGFIGQLFGVWSNIAFDITLRNTDNRALFSYMTKAGSGVINCYFNIESDTSEETYAISTTEGTNVGEAVVIKDCVFNINNSNKKVYPYYGHAFANYALIGNANLIMGLTNGYLYGITDTYRYETIADFISGQNGQHYYSAEGSSKYSDDCNGVDVSDVCYSSWEGWNISGNTISICDRVVYDGNKTTTEASIDGNILNLGTKGQFTNVYAKVGESDEALIAENVMHTFNIGAYAVENGWATLEGTLVEIRIESKNYTATISNTFKKSDASVQIDKNGIVAFDVGTETAKLYVNDVEIEDATNPFDLTAWAFDNGLSADVDYVVKVESDSYLGSATKSYKALNDANFVATLNQYNSVENSNIYFYLTEDISLIGRTGGQASQFGDMTQVITEGTISGNFVFNEMYASVDGRGFTISYTLADGNNNKIDGLIYNHFGAWQNIVFDVNVTAYGNSCGTVFIKKISDGSLINCYVDADITPHSGIAGGAPLIGETNGGLIKNCIFDMSINGTPAARFINTAYSGCEIVDCAFISQSETWQIINNNMNSTATFYGYTTHQNFVDGIGKIFVSEGQQGYGAWKTNTEHGTTENKLPVYKNWSSVWSIGSTGISMLGNNIISLG